MKRNKQFILASIIIFLATATCQTSGNPVFTPAASPTQPVTAFPLFTPKTPTASAGNKLQPPDQSPTPTVNAGNDLLTIFPSFALTDPNTVCVQHYLNALSCLDATGWHIYKDGTIPRRIVHCTDGRIYLVDDEIYQYQVEGEMLVGIGGWVDQGAIICGRGNDIWVSDYSEVMRFDGSTWTSYAVEDYFESGDGTPSMIHSLAVAAIGTGWVTTDNTIATFDGTQWEILTLPGNYHFKDSDARSQGLVIDPSGVVWITAYTESCCSDDQLLKFDGVEWSAFPGPDDNINGMQIVAVDNKNRIWAATTGNKIFSLNSDTTEWELRFDLEQFGLENEWELRFDVEQPGLGNEWELRFDTEQLGLGFGANRLHQMKFDGQGRLWVTTNYGLGIYDGVTWTIYHDYTANLYMNDISDLTILGDGPQLPGLKIKPFGSIRGKLVSETQTPFTDVLVAICIPDYTGLILCANQAENVNADGSFLISNVPAGTYRLQFKISNEWYVIESEEDGYFECTVKEGEEAQLGEITAP